MSNCFQQSNESLGIPMFDVGASVCPLKSSLCCVLFNVCFALLHSNSSTNPLRNPNTKTLTNAIALAFFFRFVSCTSSLTVKAAYDTGVHSLSQKDGKSTESVDDLQAFLAFKCTIFQGINFSSSFPFTKYETPSSEGFGS